MTTRPEMQSAEVAGIVNNLQVSGRLLCGPGLRVFFSGSKCVQAILAVPSFSGKRAMQLGVKLWVNDTNNSLVEHFLSCREGDNVVCVGSLNINFSNGKTYVDVDITKGEIVKC